MPGFADTARAVRFDIAAPPALPHFRRASLTPPDAAVPPVFADRIVIHKMARRMELIREGRPLRTYRVDLGWQTLGHKQHEGDGRTPEGIYRIESRNAQSGFHRALKISYPSPEDRARAWAKGQSPGGLIMIHGQPNNARSYERAQKKRDWTEGCIAVSNEEIEEIWTLVADGTEIELLP
ncbi:MAG: murein L,D-transpeptidase family protein [Acetobacteraceae bacterium]